MDVVATLHSHLAPRLSRLISGALITISPHLAKYIGIDLSLETIEIISTVGGVLLAHTLIHTSVSRVTNPADVAKPLPVPPEVGLPKSAAVQVPAVVPGEGQ